MPMTKVDEANFQAHLDRHISKVHSASLGLHKMLGLLEPATPFPLPPPPPIPSTHHTRHPETIDLTTSPATGPTATNTATSTARPPSPQHPGNSFSWYSPGLSTTLQTWSTLLPASSYRTTALSISFWALAPDPRPPRLLAKLTTETAHSIQLFSVAIPPHAASPDGHLNGRWLCIQLIERAHVDRPDYRPWHFLAFPASAATRRLDYPFTHPRDGSGAQLHEGSGAADGAPYVCYTEVDVDGGGKTPLVDGGGGVVDALAWEGWLEAVALGMGRAVVCMEAGGRVFEW